MTPPRALDRRLMALLAVSVFAGAGTIHYQTPMLAAFAAEFHADAAAVGWVATLTFGGFLAGTFFLVPLGDRFDKRRLILVELAVLIVALLVMASARTLPALVAASLVVGLTSGFAQLVIPLTAELAPPEKRGRVMGTLLACLFLGILFGRLAGGLIAQFLGWRWTYVAAAVMLLALAPALVLWLPSMPSRTRLGYARLIASLFGFLRSNATLRRASTIQFLLGISYGAFWATVAPMMLALHGFGPAQTGLLAIPGAAGILASQPAGRWSDRYGSFPIVTGGVCLVLAAYVVLAFAPLWVGAVIAGAVLLDSGLRSAMVANQTRITAVAPEARSRFNTVFGAHIWGGNAVGAFLASTALAHWGWTSVCAIAVGASCVALLVQWRTRGARSSH
ncbi:MAG TPA: MFS transporter [Burkholderiales bacterium]|nr:MFS transporter [Burkholderiales bacterium]